MEDEKPLGLILKSKTGRIAISVFLVLLITIVLSFAGTNKQEQNKTEVLYQAELTSVVETANQLKNTEYSSLSWEILTNALTLPETTNVERQAKIKAINDAMNELAPKDLYQSLMDEESGAATLSSVNYTKESWSVLQDALALPEVKRSEVDSKLEAIQQAKLALVYAEDTNVKPLTNNNEIDWFRFYGTLSRKFPVSNDVLSNFSEANKIEYNDELNNGPLQFYINPEGFRISEFDDSRLLLLTMFFAKAYDFKTDYKNYGTTESYCWVKADYLVEKANEYFNRDLNIEKSKYTVVNGYVKMPIFGYEDPFDIYKTTGLSYNETAGTYQLFFDALEGDILFDDSNAFTELSKPDTLTYKESDVIYKYVLSFKMVEEKAVILSVTKLR